MSYRAYGNGTIQLSQDLPYDLCDDLEVYEAEIHDDNELSICCDGNYHEDEIIEFLEKIKPYASSGEINFEGESGDFWRFILKDGEWLEQNGHISYSLVSELDNPAKAEFIGQLIDQVEDALCENMNELKTRMNAGPDEPLIEGKLYADISARLCKTLSKWNLL